jgi:cellobiose epimerase
MKKYVISFSLHLLWLICLSCATQTRENELAKDSLNREQLATQIEASLREETLDRWYPMCFDEESGGFITTYTFDWKPKGDQDKMIVTQARHTWVNAKASLMYPDDIHFKKGAQIGFQFLKEKMWDKEFGGFYSLVNKKGEVLDESKNAYGNSFAIYALAGYYGASKDTSALNLAKKAFLWLEKFSHDPALRGYFQHMKRDGTVIQRTSATDSHQETGFKDQNSSIHLLEAFTELYQVWPDPLLKERLQEMLVLIRDTIATPKGYLTLFFLPDWEPVSFRDSTREFIEEHHSLDHVSFGHDIETAYLLLEASEILGLHDDKKTIQTAKGMVDHCLANGFDHVSGGIYDEGYYFPGDSTLTITRDTKNWWAQAEGMNTLLIMADLFPRDSMNYEKKFLQQWNYIDKYLIDHEHGDWFAGGLDKEPLQKTALKGHQWKATYHHFRSMANCLRRLRESH